MQRATMCRPKTFTTVHPVKKKIKQKLPLFIDSAIFLLKFKANLVLEINAYAKDWFSQNKWEVCCTDMQFPLLTGKHLTMQGKDWDF